MQNTLYTIGYEGVTVDALVKTLAGAGVKLLLDVRAVPLSRKPGFSKNKLAERLGQAGIRYLGLKGLGTPAAGRDAARKGRIAEMRTIFEDHLKTPPALTAMEDAIQAAQNQPVCLLCFEYKPESCHRHVVADRISEQTGQKIVHLNPVVDGLISS